MPIPSPFHARTQALCETYKWKDWAGFYAVCTYTQSLEREYSAIRQGVAMFDVTPLFKYDVRGVDAAEFLARVMVRNVGRMKPGRMTYLCWCDDAGKVLDDGTCARLAPDHFRVTAAAPSYWWLAQQAVGYDVEIHDLTEQMGALALQGPTSRALLEQVCDVDLDKMRYFDVAEADFSGAKGYLSRTGYTGDLGYEVWVDNADAVAVWDLLMNEGRSYGISPAGLDALDISRVEAGFIMNGVDYFSANETMIEAQKSTPYELGLGWTVKLKDPDRFIGQPALEAENASGSALAFVGLEIDWEALEALFDAIGLPPDLPCGAWRTAVPVFHRGRQVGRATSGTWSPVLKKNLALATVEASVAAPGTRLEIEQTVEWERRTVPATVLPLPFYDPERKRA